MKVNIYDTDKKYNIIYADPPWSYRNKGKVQGGTNSHYSTMPQEEIENMGNVIKKISNKNCMLFLWVTFPKIQEGLDTIKAWGFEYKTIGFNWIKKNKNGTNFFGIGWYTRSNSEVCLIGTKGKLIKKSNSISQIVESVREEHSKKPDIVRKRIVELCGDVPRIELFARQEVERMGLLGK